VWTKRKNFALRAAKVSNHSVASLNVRGASPRDLLDPTRMRHRRYESKPRIKPEIGAHVRVLREADRHVALLREQRGEGRGSHHRIRAVDAVMLRKENR